MAMAFASLVLHPRVTDSAIDLSDEQSGARSGCTRICGTTAAQSASEAAASAKPKRSSKRSEWKFICLLFKKFRNSDFETWQDIAAVDRSVRWNCFRFSAARKFPDSPGFRIGDPDHVHAKVVVVLNLVLHPCP